MSIFIALLFHQGSRELFLTFERQFASGKPRQSPGSGDSRAAAAHLSQAYGFATHCFLKTVDSPDEEVCKLICVTY